MKSIVMFEPAHRPGREEAERHYSEVHHRFARNLFRQTPSIEHYSAHRAIAQYDVTGHFDQAPRYWRFVMTQLRELAPSQQSIDVWTPQVMGSLWYDHTNFLRELRGFEVDPRTLVDRRGEQMSFAKVMFVSTLREDADRDAAAQEHAGEHAPAMAAAFEAAYGARVFTSNTVIRERETVAYDEPGQRYSGRDLPTTTLIAFDEYWFDNRAWAEEFFAQPATLDRIRSIESFRSEGLLIEERVGVDTR